ncbi:MAG: hypothetical protein H0V97_05360 [Actinobacteria bacterium]|nr:hypothetical protein [Actinomycetota bacterium]
MGSAERRRSSLETDVVRKNLRQSVEIQVTHVGPDLQFQSAEVKGTPAEEKQNT